MNKTTHSKDLPFFVYDCFTDTRFGGNIGGIVFNAGGLSVDDMQNIAREINAPVTGFVTDQKARNITARFFMPGAEIAMCGHVTVGLFSHLSTDRGDGEFTLTCGAGKVTATVTTDAGALPTVMMQAALPSLKPANLSNPDLAEALGLPAKAFTPLNPPEIAEAGLTHLFVQLATAQAVDSLTPDFTKLTALSKACGVQTVACFAMLNSGPGHRLHIRDFCPAVGVDEVPASGTTNGALMGYLLRHGLLPDGAQTVLAAQGVKLGRPSLIRCETDAAKGTLTQVRIGGQAVASLQGTVARG